MSLGDEILDRMLDDRDSDWPERLLLDIARAKVVYDDPEERIQYLRPIKPTDHRDRNLTSREKMVLACSARGLTTFDTAEVLGIGEETVKTHKKKIIAIFKAKNITHAVYLAAKQGLV